MTTIQTERPQAVYALGHTPEEYERLRAQARAWETATGRLLDQVGLGPGASCLDAGCGRQTLAIHHLPARRRLA